MSVDLGQFFPFDWQGRPPHISPRDFVLWERFFIQHAKSFLGFHFDVSLGTPGVVPPNTDPSLIKMWERITLKRIDVVGVRSDQWWLMEFRPAAAGASLGAVITYRDLWISNPPDSKSVIAAIVTDIPDPDLIPTAFKNNVRVIVV